MQREIVTSTNVAEVGYDESRRVLEVLFRNGGLYQYFDVPRHVFDELRNAASVGQYLNAHVKPNYRYARI